MADQETPLFDFDSAAAPDTTLSNELEQALQTHFGLSGFRAGQQQVIERVMQGRSTLALMPTGAGKSLCYQLPSLLLPHATIVISPLIALMKDQIDGLPPAVRERSTLINSSLDFATIRSRLRDLAAGRYKLVYVAPERLRQRQFLHALQHVGISLFVVDEAHCVSLWGLSFRPDYLFLREALQTLGSPPILAMTATASPVTEREIRQQLGDLDVVRTNVFRPNLNLEVIRVSNQTMRSEIIEELCCTITGSVIVYVRSKAGCDDLASRLRDLGVEAEAYHAGRADRDAIQDRFMRGETRVIAATIAFGMGVDKPDVRAVIHQNLPKSLDDYTQEAGRAGRDGLPARCILLYSPSDKGQLSQWMEEEAFSIEELRDLYGKIRRFVRFQRQALVTSAALGEATSLEETRLRVGLGMLERAGLIRRHFDAPGVLRMGRGANTDSHFQQFATTLGLNGWSLDWSIDAVAEALQQPYSAIEPQLLDWQNAGFVEYDGFQREMVLEILEPPTDSPQRMTALLREYRQAQEQRLEALGDYARSKQQCRHRTLAAHFGQRLQPCGDACDTCQRGQASIAPRVSVASTAAKSTPIAWSQRPLIEQHRTIIEAVALQQGTQSSRNLAHILTGSRGYGDHPMFGKLSNRSFDSVRAEIDVLVEAGHLAYRGALLVTTEADQSRQRQPALVILQALTRLPFGLGRTGLARLLKGASNSPIQPQRSPDHGILSHLSVNYIEEVIEALITAGLILRDERDSYRLLRLAEEGQAALDDPSNLPPLISYQHKGQPSATADLELLKRLQQWRATQADRQGVPRFCIFPDTVLYDIATIQPTTHGELRHIKGIGPQKLAQWGDELIELIKT